jgi:hypothetical protein
LKDFVKKHEGDFKLDKSLELNQSMTIDNNYQEDELTKTNKNLESKGDNTLNE